MTGAEHYTAAERLLADATLEGADDGTPIIDAGMGHVVAAAQVHATLALAVATAELAGLHGGVS